MIKKIFITWIIFLLLPIISASCSDINLQINGINTENNYITIQRLIGENEQSEVDEIEEIKVYVDNKLELTDEIGISILESRMLNIPTSLSKGQEIRVDIILDDGVCEYKNTLSISDENIYNYAWCDYTKKSKGKWCIGNKVFTQKCIKGQFEDKSYVDCEALNEICEDGECVESGNENNIIALAEHEENSLENTPNDGTNEEFYSKSKSLIEQKGDGEDCSSNVECKSNICNDEKCSSNNLIIIILNWFVNLFKAKLSLFSHVLFSKL